MDNPFFTPSDGEADWDSSLNANVFTLDRGYHVRERAGTLINTGEVLWLSSGGFFVPFDPNSTSIFPMAMAYTAAASGDSMTALTWGIVRSLGINSPAVAGGPLYVSMSTPGVIVSSYTGADRQIGWGLDGYGVLFQPSKNKSGGGGSLASLSDVNTNGLTDGRVLQWADASSRWVPVAPVTGRTQVGSMSDVDRTGLANGSILKWSDATSKFVMSVDSTGGGGGGFDAGSPPPITQFTWNGSGTACAFAASPSSGALIVAIAFSADGDVNASGWTKLVENTTGLDFGFITSKRAGSTESSLQNPITATGNNGGVAMWEFPPSCSLVLGAISGGEANTSVTQVGAALLPNVKDCTGLSAVAATTTVSLGFNAGVSDVQSSTGNRKMFAGHTDLTKAPMVGVFAQLSATGNNKTASALVSK